MAASHGAFNMKDYTNLRTVPAMMTVVFAAATLYQFGGVPAPELLWANYVMTTQHAMIVSLGTYAIAFASSETKSFERYSDQEKALIAGGPLLIIGHEYVTFLADIPVQHDPLGGIVFFAVVMVGWGVAVR